MDNNKPSGVYCITNTINGKTYIGQSVDMKRRMAAHRSHLNRGDSNNIVLQRAWDKYGKDSFVFSVLEFCDKDILTLREDFWIDKLDSIKNGYNILDARRSSSGMLGKKHSKKSIKKMSESVTGVLHHFFGKKMDEEIKKKISETLRGHKVKKKTRFKISCSLTGKIQSKETREKRALSLRNKKRKKSKNSSSKFFGVSLVSRTRKWKSSINIFFDKKEKIHLGYFDNEIDAAKAYDNYIIKNGFDFPLNFSKECEK